MDEHGELTDIDLGSPAEGAAAPQSGDSVPVSTPLRESSGLSNGAVASPQPRSTVASSSPSDEPQDIVLGTGVQSITLTTYEDSEPMPHKKLTVGSQPANDQVHGSSH